MQQINVTTQENNDNILVFQVNFLLDRYHGKEWPPSPRRLFLSLVSALHQGGGRRIDIREGEKSLSFLEHQEAPKIYTPSKIEGCKYSLSVPNNDMDVISSNYGKKKKTAKKSGELVTLKEISPHIVNMPIHYIYKLNIQSSEDKEYVDILCNLAREVPVLGLGIDPVLIDGKTSDTKSHSNNYELYLPDTIKGKDLIQVPDIGLLEDAKKHHQEFANRIKNKSFINPTPITTFKNQPYLREVQSDEIIGFKIKQITEQSSTSVIIQDSLSEKIINSTYKEIQGILKEQDKDVKVVLLPSIGNKHADGLIRRISIIVPPTINNELKILLKTKLTFVSIEGQKYQIKNLPTKDPVLRAYKRKTKFFASVFPIVLDTTEDMTKAVLEALEKEGIHERVIYVRFKKEPNWPSMEKIPKSSQHTHIEIEFESEVRGPIVLGNMQEKGYGLCAPRNMPSIAYFTVLGMNPPIKKTVQVGQLIRRAVMSKIGTEENNKIPQYISGHDSRGKPLTKHRHAFWLPFDSNQDGFIDHIAIYVKDGFGKNVQDIIHKITNLSDGEGLNLNLRFNGFYSKESINKKCALFRKSKKWNTMTPYFVPWHLKKNFKVDDQVKKELKNKKLDYEKIVDSERPAFNKNFTSKCGKHLPPSNIGNNIRIEFKAPVSGPIILGFGSHFGLGMFVPE